METFKNGVFKFFFIYFLLIIAPWSLLDGIPGIGYITKWFSQGMEWIVFAFNDSILHVKDTLNTEGYGSGDTSYAWAQFYTIILLSLLIAFIWSFFDKNISKSLDYWLRILLRYNLIMVALSYGIIKLFMLQMPSPSLSQLATPMGNYLPMRFSWMFIGYSGPYQFFSGMMEVMVGLLLLYRRTIPLGLIIGFGVFVNVFVLNLCYDIPVKLYSMQIVICCLFLLVIDCNKYLNFFIFNKPTHATTAYNFTFTKKWQKIGRITLKTVFILFAIGYTLYDSIIWKQEMDQPEVATIPYGVYQIQSHKKNNQLITVNELDSLSWKDFIFDKQKMGSIRTADTTFMNRYGRAYFIYETDKDKHIIRFKEGRSDSVSVMDMNYKFINANTMHLKGVFKKDTLFYELVKIEKPFPLAEKQFHWISEANR